MIFIPFTALSLSLDQIFTKFRMSINLRKLFFRVCKGFEAELVEFDAEHDHLLINFVPKIEISKLVSSLKVISNRQLKKQN